jgi:hypothetical protein
MSQMVELVRLLLVWHIFETCRVTFTVYCFFGYLTMIFNWLESNVANRLNVLWKELLVHFSQFFPEATEENRDCH